MSLNSKPAILTAAILTFAASLPLAHAAAPASIPLPLSNPSFEDGTFVDTGGGYDNLAPGSTDIAGWTTIGHTISWAHVPNSDNIGSSDGNYFLDLTGPGAGTPGGLTQNVPTTPGQEYSISLAIMTINVPVTVELDAGSSSTQFVTSDVNAWDTFTFLFQATDPVTPVTIQGIDGYNVIGVDAPPGTSAPEPSSLALLTSAAALMLRRRSRTKRTTR